MATSPFPRFPEWAEQALKGLTPPAWLVDEAQQRLVLFLNHVLMHEPQAQQRLLRQKGRRVQLRWRDLSFEVAFTPAGLLERQVPSDQADLVLSLNEPAPFELVKTVMQGQRPSVRIEGDVQLAAEVNWLIDHVRWDPEEDLARLIGDAPAHTLAQMAQRVMAGLKAFVAQRRGAAGAASEVAAP
jgi:ubiquinone biosynthesis protein UbiJ